MKAVLALLLVVLASAADAICVTDPQPCTLPGGTYHIVLPDSPAPYPAVMFLHGYGGAGQGTMKNTGMVNAMLARGYAVIAPDGQTMDDRNGRSWDFHPDFPATRNEAAFIKAVADDAAGRFGLTRDRMLLAGFSIGGSMVSYVACADPEAFAAYAPVAGSFWRPHPAACKAPVRLLHTHGWTDLTVPLEGRQIGADFVQGDVFQAMQIWREVNGCSRLRPDAFPGETTFMMRSWTSCLPGARLDFALHDGGHAIPQGWVTLALDWFEAP